MAEPSLEAFSVHHQRPNLVVLVLCDPHLVHGRDGAEDGGTEPRRVLALWRKRLRTAQSGLRSRATSAHERGGAEAASLTHLMRKTRWVQSG
eukprot:1564516-Pleurochrysis_carterae.AAC.2